MSCECDCGTRDSAAWGVLNAESASDENKEGSVCEMRESGLSDVVKPSDDKDLWLVSVSVYHNK